MLKLERFAFRHRGLDRHVVAEAAWNEKARAGVDHRVAGANLYVSNIWYFEEPGRGGKHRGGRAVEHLEIARIEHDAGRIAFAPLDAAGDGVGEEGHYFGAILSEPSIRMTSPLR